MSRAVFILSILVVVCSCRNDNVIEIDFSAHVQVLDNEPNSVVFHIDGQVPSNTIVKVQNKATGKVDAVVLIKTSYHQNKCLVSHLSAGTEYVYEVSADAQSVLSGEFTTREVPAGYSDFLDAQLEGDCDLDGNYLLMNKMSEPSGIFLLNAQGQVVWSRLSDNFVKMVKLTQRGTLLTLEDNLGDKFGNGNLIYETTFTGDTLVSLVYGDNEFDRMAHHDVILTSRGTYAFITNVNVDGVVVDGITELNGYGEKIWEWDMAKHVLPVKPGEVFNQPWGNSLEEDIDGNFLVSFRALCQVWSINAVSGDVTMKFGKQEGMGVAYDDLPLFQHDAQWLSGGELLLFDNGSHKERAFSRVMKYSVNVNDQSAGVIDCLELPKELFSPFMSAVETYRDGYLVTCSIPGVIAFIDASGEVEWSIKMGDRMFRAQLVDKKI